MTELTVGTKCDARMDGNVANAEKGRIILGPAIFTDRNAIISYVLNAKTRLELGLPQLRRDLELVLGSGCGH